MSELQELMAWYRAHCNGEWEHAYGVSIDTLDNPGWLVKIDVIGTPLSGRTFAVVTRGVEDGADEWLHCEVKDGQFTGASSPEGLQKMLAIFLGWARG